MSRMHLVVLFVVGVMSFVAMGLLTYDNKDRDPVPNWMIAAILLQWVSGTLALGVVIKECFCPKREEEEGLPQ